MASKTVKPEPSLSLSAVTKNKELNIVGIYSNGNSPVKVIRSAILACAALLFNCSTNSLLLDEIAPTTAP
jgi:hypothetical protein